jgi:hypothetical protein
VVFYFTKIIKNKIRLAERGKYLRVASVPLTASDICPANQAVYSNFY